jgi:hypothetical protein
MLRDRVSNFNLNANDYQGNRNLDNNKLLQSVKHINQKL